VNSLSQKLRRLPFLLFIVLQGLLVFFGAFSWRPGAKLGRLRDAIEAYGTMTRTLGPYRFFAPPVEPQLFVQIHADGPPPFDEMLGSDMTQETTLKMGATQSSFSFYRNIPLLLEFASRQFFERHPEYKTVELTFGWYTVPSRSAWRSGERTSMRKSLEMSFERSD
jgi:hypothetical protein